MAPVRLRLHHRILIPFVLMAVVSTSVAAIVSLSVIADALESRVKAQLLSTSGMVSRSDFALNPSILRTVKEITGADVITYAAGGSILASTLDDRKAALASMVTSPDATRAGLGDESGSALVRPMNCGVPCFVTYHRVTNRPDTVVALIAETAELTSATRAIRRTIVLSAALSLLAMILVSQIVTRRVAAPLEQLVAFTRDVSSESSGRRAPIGDDEIGRLAAAFNDMLERLEQSQTALLRSEKLAVAGLLAARVAHDVRNPLSSIKMQTQLVRSRLPADAQSQSLLAAVLRDIDTVESVVRDLLELARPGELKRQPTQLESVAREALEQWAPQLTHRKIAVETDFAAGLPPIELDGARFKQALLNVILNAADAMPVGGTLRIATRAADGGSTVALDVCDDGIGIDPAVLTTVFDPFVSTKRDGIGLGLVNAKAVVESHGGRIELACREPKGTRVTMSFPVSRPPRSGPEAVRDSSNG